MDYDAASIHFPVLATQRLRLRQIQATDAEALFAIRSDKQVMEPYGQEPHRSLDATRKLIYRLQHFYEQHEAIFWGVTLKQENTVIGSCTIWNIRPDFHYAEIGYDLNRTYWRQGIMSEALPAILTYGFADLGLHRMEANVGARNIPSSDLLLKLGFTYEGTARQRYLFRGQLEDELHFGMLKDEWLKST